ncbi:MAG: putative DNA binding domain-containing protein [Lachnospiraceae bacterium]|nr:putative DNA binding domain-containing protein [Lachnospiraceae bacterium]
MKEKEREYYFSLINELRKLPAETEWVEFKENNDMAQIIGEYLSALSNSAALHERDKAYMVYGVHNETHDIVGTKFRPRETKVGNEELENWLLTLLSPHIDFKYVEVAMDKGNVVLIEIPAAKVQPTAFKGVEYIRVGSLKKKLKDFPEKERKLWRSFEIRPFETMPAKENIDSEVVTKLLDTGAFYTLMSLPVPSTRDGIIHDFLEYGFIKGMDNGHYSVTNMGALLFAKDIRKFDYLENKRIRVIKYKGSGRTSAIRDQFFYKGYAVEFNEIVNYIMSMLPQGETIETALRQEFIMFPEKAVREMLGNLIIHQDLTSHGQSLMVEIFDERIEATNPGNLLIDVDRIIDTAPHSRNEKMADFLRLVHICEVRGSGFDRMEEGMRDWKIPAPKVETGEDFCRTMLYWHGSLSKWTKEEKTRTCYIYVCYCYVNGIEVSNAILRERFGITEVNKAMVSRIIKDTVEAGKIKLKDPHAADKMRRYIPYWA